MIPYEDLGRLNESFFDEFDRKFKEIARSGWYILGEHVRDFENEFAAYCGSRHCAGVASGLDAMILAIRALELPIGSEIIVPSNTYIATILAIVTAGCKPVLVEPDLKTYNINPALIGERVTSRTTAVLIVHLYGKACSMESIVSVCASYNLKLIEDCAQSHGAKFKGRKVGTFGDFGAFSFYPTKNLGALGDGGALTTDNELLDKAIRSLRNYGSSVKYYNDVVGFNSRLDEVQAGLLSVKLRKLDSINAHKRRLAGIYLAGLKEDFIKPDVHPDHEDVYHIFNVRHPRRDELRNYLERNGVKTEVHYPVPPHSQQAYSHMFAGDYPISEMIHSTTVSLPISFFHSDDDVATVVEVMNRF